MKADGWIDEVTLELTEVPEPLKSSICYALTTGGKRLRPILSMLGARIAGANEDEVKNFAVAVELIHTYSWSTPIACARRARTWTRSA